MHGGIPVGLPAPAWLLELGAVFIRTETELVLKSRRVVPGRLLDAGFRFDYPDWACAARELVARWRRSHSILGARARLTHELQH
jgi:NAD dependent epimerase/dehydratase family enzyme